MGMKGLFPLFHRGPSRAVVAGSFTTVGSGNPTVTTGRGFTVTRGSAGVYTVTLSDTPNAIDCVCHSVALATDASTGVTNEDQDARTSTAVTINLLTTADSSTTDFALDDDTGSIVSFVIYLRNTNVTDP